MYDFKLQIFKLVNDEENINVDIWLSFVLNQVISSALLLYRLRCLFPVEVQHGERYKCVWEANLVHKASGVTLKFFDCQGAAKAHPSTDDLSQQFLEDEVELLNLLCDPHCPWVCGHTPMAAPWQAAWHDTRIIVHVANVASADDTLSSNARTKL